VSPRTAANLFWADKAGRDTRHPVVFFDPSDPMFSTLSRPPRRQATSRLPMLHGDMVRYSAFSPVLDDMVVAAWSEYCHPWVSDNGPEATYPDPRHPGWRRLRIPQLFHARVLDRRPVIGSQFHPGAKDLRGLAPDAPPEARGDAWNVFANAIDLVD
jgi:hypothetical protein